MATLSFQLFVEPRPSGALYFAPLKGGKAPLDSGLNKKLKTKSHHRRAETQLRWKKSQKKKFIEEPKIFPEVN